MHLLKSILLIFTISLVIPLHAQDYKLVWSDEFNGSGLPSPQRWSYDVGGDGWGNKERQYYTSERLENARIEEGLLIIEARKEEYKENNYTSARLVSKNKGDWKYARIEVRANLPGGTGAWPAIWMLPTEWLYGGWPTSGEIDIMEYVGYNPGVVHGTVHTAAFNHLKGTQKGDTLVVPDVEDSFHIYAIEWTGEKIDFLIDDQQYFTFENMGEFEKWPFDQEFHVILNCAVGGDWAGAKGVDDTIFPIQFEIDYVRVYQK